MEEFKATQDPRPRRAPVHWPAQRSQAGQARRCIVNRCWTGWLCRHTSSCLPPLPSPAPSPHFPHLQLDLQVFQESRRPEAVALPVGHGRRVGRHEVQRVGRVGRLHKAGDAGLQVPDRPLQLPHRHPPDLLHLDGGDVPDVAQLLRVHLAAVSVGGWCRSEQEGRRSARSSGPQTRPGVRCADADTDIPLSPAWSLGHTAELLSLPARLAITDCWCASSPQASCAPPCPPRPRTCCTPCPRRPRSAAQCEGPQCRNRGCRPRQT